MANSQLRLLLTATSFCVIATVQTAQAQDNFLDFGLTSVGSGRDAVVINPKIDAIEDSVSSTAPLFFGAGRPERFHQQEAATNKRQIVRTIDWEYSVPFDGATESPSVRQTLPGVRKTSLGVRQMPVTPVTPTAAIGGRGGKILPNDLSKSVIAGAVTGPVESGDDWVSNQNGITVSRKDVGATPAKSKPFRQDRFANLSDIPGGTVRY